LPKGNHSCSPKGKIIVIDALKRYNIVSDKEEVYTDIPLNLITGARTIKHKIRYQGKG